MKNTKKIVAVIMMATIICSIFIFKRNCISCNTVDYLGSRNRCKNQLFSNCDIIRKKCYAELFKWRSLLQSYSCKNG